MIDSMIRWVVARIWRHRIALPSGRDEPWHAMNPGRCMYCAYTRWANEERGQRLKIGVHNCIEGNGPPHPLPKATARKAP